MRRYWTRLMAAVLLGVLFGLTNGSFVWVTRTLFDRLDPKQNARIVASGSAEGQQTAAVAPKTTSAFTARIKAVGRRLDEKLDPWLPLAGRKLNWRQVLGGLLILPVMVAFSRYIGYLGTYCTNWVSERVVADLRVAVLAKLNSLSLDFFNRSTMGDLMTRVNTDTAQLHRCMSLGFTDLIKEPITITCVLAALFLVDWKLTLLALVFLPLCILPLVTLGRKIRRASRNVTSAIVSQSSLLVEALSGIRVVKAFGLEEEQIARYREFTKQAIHHGMKGVQARELVNPLIETISMLGLGMLIVTIFYTGSSVPDLVGFLTGVVVIFTPFKKLAGVHVMFQQTSVGVNRLLEIFREQPTVKESPQAKAIKSFERELRFEKVDFSYGKRPVLQGVDLVVPRGFRLGIVGESGSGKSTLVNLIFRFYDPTGGGIKIDGQDLRDLHVKDLRAQMALVSQEIMLFDQTVAENIACGRLGATRAEVETAARQAYAHDFIQQLEQGYDARVGERGVTLSGGQRQRLAIARAFVRNAPILVLDEATAALDSQAESEVQAAIERLEENRTVICVAHRLSTLSRMDKIIVLSSAGRVVEEGAFAELLRRDGIFADMARKQGIRA